MHYTHLYGVTDISRGLANFELTQHKVRILLEANIIVTKLEVTMKILFTITIRAGRHTL